MTANTRIALNVIATYGRSLFRLVCGLFTARWVLMSLGETDYGLYGLIGGLTAFLTFLNSHLATAVGRFYAYSVGESNKPGNGERGLKECQKWFSAAIVLHTIIPAVIIGIGYFVGKWAVSNYLSIPSDRVVACQYVWLCACVSCLFSMANVPFHAMYTAKQNIAELTIYDFAGTTLNVAVMYYMVSHPSDWLVRYAVWMMLLSVVPQILIGVRGVLIYPECRIVRRAMFKWSILKPILSFSGYQLLNGFSMILSNQGQGVVINKYIGPAANAAMTIGNQVSAHTQSLSAAIAGAFYPAIVNLAGEGKKDAMKKMALRASRFGTLALLMFTIPLCVEIDMILKLWLKHPPAGAESFCVLVLSAMVLDKVSSGHWMSIFAIGKIRGYQLAACIPSFFAFVLGWILVAHGVGVASIGIALVASKIITNMIRIPFGREIAEITFASWIATVIIPVCIVSVSTLCVGFASRILLPECYVRIFPTTICCLISFIAITWFLVLDNDERAFCIRKVRSLHFYKCLHDLKNAAKIFLCQQRYKRVLDRLRAKIKNNTPIKVLFLVHVSSKWKCQSLYDWFKRNAAYEPIVCLDIDVSSPEMKDIDVGSEREFYKARGCRVTEIKDNHIDADMVFYQEPFGNRLSLLPYSLSARALTFYVPYYVATHDTWQRACLIEGFHGFLFRQFAPSKAWADYYMAHVNKINYGGRIVGLGHPMLDLIRGLDSQKSTPEEKDSMYVIYAPHFSFRNDIIPVAIDISTFRETGQKILSYAKMHPEFNWLFKPHPMLRWFLSASGLMTESEVSQYYKAWENLGAACYDGNYIDYFNKSRALITDCSSFLGEYSATGNPIIHLVYGHNKDLNNKPASVVESLFKAFYTVQNDEDLWNAFVVVLENGDDPKRAERLAAATEVGFYGQKAADKIGEYIDSIVHI